MATRAGRLRYRVEIQTLIPTADSFGEPDPTWATTAERYMELLAQDGRETIAAQQRLAEVTHLLRTRYVGGMGPKQRLRLADGRLLDILAVLDVDGRQREFDLHCREIVNG